MLGSFIMLEMTAFKIRLPGKPESMLQFTLVTKVVSYQRIISGASICIAPMCQIPQRQVRRHIRGEFNGFLPPERFPSYR